MAQKLNSLEIKVIKQVLGVNIYITRQGSVEVTATSLGDYRNNSISYFFHKQPNGEIYVRRQIKGGYAPYGWGAWGQKYIYVIHRNPATNDYNGFSDVMEAANWLKRYIRRRC